MKMRIMLRKEKEGMMLIRKSGLIKKTNRKKKEKEARENVSIQREKKKRKSL